MKSIKKIACLVGILLVLVLGLSACNTVHGFGEDLDTMGRGMSNHHDTPKQVQKEDTNK